MKRVALAGCVALVSVLILAACLPSIPNPLNINLSSPTLVPQQSPSPVASPTVTPTIEPSSTPTFLPTSTFTPIPSLTPTVFSSPTATSISTDTAIPIVSGTPAAISMTVVVETDTAGLHGPLNSIYLPAHIDNFSHSQVDISLHCTTIKGVEIVLEFNNVRHISTNLPQGNYVYVAYVGGRQMIGNFSFLTARKLRITIYSDSVVIH